MKWNQKTIHQWGIDTFGQAALNTLGVAIRMAKETIELSNILLTSDDVDKISMEAADVTIVLVQVANCIGFDTESSFVDEELDSKLDTEIDVSFVMNAATIDLISCLFHKADIKQVSAEMIKIMTCVRALEDIYQFDLTQRVQEKMEINFAREWAKGKDGSFQHV